MAFLLDTNAWVDVLRGTSPRVQLCLSQASPAEICYDPIVLSELIFGAKRSRAEAANLQRVRQLLAPHFCLALDAAAGEAAAVILADLVSRGIQIKTGDLLIVATAVTNGLTLVTHNVPDFRHIPNLELDDWHE